MIRRLLRILPAAAAACAFLPGLPAAAQPAALEPVSGPDGAPFVERGWSAWQRAGTRHRFENGRLELIAGLLVRTQAGAPPPAPVLSAPREVVPGAPLRVYLAAAQPLSGVQVSVRTAAGTLVSARAFVLHGGAAGDPYDRLWVAVLGIPSTAEPGIGQLLVTGAGGPESVAAEVPVLQAAEPLFIGTRRFAEEEIPLRKGLGELRRRDDPERVEQARELWRLLGTWRPVDDGHTGRLRHPVVGPGAAPGSATGGCTATTTTAPIGPYTTASTSRRRRAPWWWRPARARW